MDTEVTIINLVQLIYSIHKTSHLSRDHVTLDVNKKLPQYREMMEILFTPKRLSLNILIYYLHSCIYFINISAISEHV
jgi:hypothetical protein